MRFQTEIEVEMKEAGLIDCLWGYCCEEFNVCDMRFNVGAVIVLGKLMVNDVVSMRAMCIY